MLKIDRGPEGQGGRGLTLVHLDAGDALASAVAFTSALQLIGAGRGGKAREKSLKGAPLLPHVGKCVRKGCAQDVMPKAAKLSCAADSR